MAGVDPVPSIPEHVRRVALHFPSSDSGERLPPGVEIVEVDGGVLVLTQTTSVVDVPELEAERVGSALEQVRAGLRAAGRRWAYWSLDADRADLVAALRARGLAQNTRPPWEARFTALVQVQEPEGGHAPTDVTARRIETLDEAYLAGDLLAEIYPTDEEARTAVRERAPRRFAYEQTADAVTRSYIAFLDGDPVGVATSVFRPTVVNLMGGSVLPTARGRGAYRALVEARWRDAVARGTPALTVQAGAMSRPILERLGFVPVGGIEVLLDEL